MIPVPQKIAAGLMLLSGITHPSQLFLFDLTPETAGPAKFGAIFFLVGLGLLTRFRVALVIAILLTLLGGVGSVQRLAAGDPTTPLTPIHAGIDFVVIGLCVTALIQRRNSETRAASV